MWKLDKEIELQKKNPLSRTRKWDSQSIGKSGKVLAGIGGSMFLWIMVEKIIRDSIHQKLRAICLVKADDFFLWVGVSYKEQLRLMPAATDAPMASFKHEGNL